MNVHSQEKHVATALAPEPVGKIEQRRSHILQAAERVFLKKGFAGATMQDVAAAAAMSPGNIYRYFPSKSLIIAGLVERDRADMQEKFALIATLPQKMLALEQLGREYFKTEACPNSPLTLEIWASASRDPEIRVTCEMIENAVTSNIMALLESARANGEIVPDANLEMICAMIKMMSDGIMRESAVSADADIDYHLNVMFSAVHAACAGHVPMRPPVKEGGQA
jgi:TetR/AcrR family transcriptional regulator, repressor for uid operon